MCLLTIAFLRKIFSSIGGFSLIRGFFVFVLFACFCLIPNLNGFSSRKFPVIFLTIQNNEYIKIKQQYYTGLKISQFFRVLLL